MCLYVEKKDAHIAVKTLSKKMDFTATAGSGISVTDVANHSAGKTKK